MTEVIVTCACTATKSAKTEQLTTPYITMPSTQITPNAARTLIGRLLRQLNLTTSSYSKRNLTGPLLRDEYTTTEVWFVEVTDAIRLQNHLAAVRPGAEVTRRVDTRIVLSCPHHVTIKW